MIKLSTLFVSFAMSLSLFQGVHPVTHRDMLGEYSTVSTPTLKYGKKKTTISIFKKYRPVFFEFSRPSYFVKPHKKKLHTEKHNRKPRRNRSSSPTVVESSTPWEVTFYASNDAGMNGAGITASGAPVESGLTIAAPSNLPFGTRVFIPRLGWRLVQDRGGGIYGDHLDVYVQNNTIAFQLGVIYTKILICIPHQTPYWA